jgi:hypothetical protein
MATHDYVIANGTGAAVRTDLNNALAAIVSNNSSSSAPATTYAYQWWADTSNNILKIRNSANNAWVELLQLDGTLTLEDGSASTPGLAFRDDLNTGIFSSAADTFNIATGGVERVKLDGTEIVFNDSGANVDFRIEGDTSTALFFADAGNNRVGIDNANPATMLDVNGDVTITDKIIHSGDTDTAIRFPSNGSIACEVDNIERLRIDNSNGVTAKHTTSANLRIQNSTAATDQTCTLDMAPANTLSGVQLKCTSEEDFSTGANRTARLSIEVRKDGTLSEKFRITPEGNVGVGSTVPQAFNSNSTGITKTRLEVDAGDTTNTMHETACFRGGADGNDASARVRICHGGDRGMILQGGRSSNAAFGKVSISDQNGDVTTSVHIDSAGSWFWGKTAQSSATPGVELYKDGPHFMTRSAGGGTVLGLNDSTGTSGGIMKFYFQDVHRGSLQYNGSDFQAVNASDYRLKENDTPISDGITRVKQLRPIRFNWKTDSSTIYDGFFAHEVQNVVPAAVIGEKDSTIGPRGEGYQMMSSVPLIPLLTAAIKELIVKVEALESA